MEGGTALHLQDASPCCTTPLPTTLPRPSTTRWEVLSHSWFVFLFVGWLLQMDESLTVGLHRPVVVAQLGKPRHSRWPVTPPQLSDTTGKAASLSVVRHTATVVSGTTGKAGSLPVVSHTATVVKHNWESCGLLHPSDATVHTKAIDKHHVGWPGADSTLQTSLWTMVNSCKLQKSDAAAPCLSAAPAPCAQDWLLQVQQSTLKQQTRAPRRRTSAGWALARPFRLPCG